MYLQHLGIKEAHAHLRNWFKNVSFCGRIGLLGELKHIFEFLCPEQVGSNQELNDISRRQNDLLMTIQGNEFIEHMVLHQPLLMVTLPNVLAMVVMDSI